MLHEFVVLLLQIQLPIAAGLATLLVYLANQVAVFRALGDWTKRAATALAAGFVLVTVRALGGEAEPGLLEIITTVVGGGTVAAAPIMVAYKLARIAH